MLDIYLSLNNNLLRLHIIENNNIKKTSAEITSTTVDGSAIKDVATLTAIVEEQIKQLTKLPKNKLSLNIVAEPQDVVLRFITINKRDGLVQDQILAEIKSKLDDVKLEDMYFSYQKIAPFLYQFIGIKKEMLESYLELANGLGITLRSVVPWVLLLPKYANINEPSIFISKIDGTQVVALSELNGIFFNGVYAKEKTTEEIEKFINELAFYKRSTPITKVYTLNYDSFHLSKYEIVKMNVPVSESDAAGFEVNVITNFMADTNPSVLASQINLLNLLPVPVIEKKSGSLVYVGSTVAAVLVLGLLIGGVALFRQHTGGGNELAQNQSGDTTQVLSENTAAPDTNESSESTAVGEKTAEMPKLDRKDLKILVKNGAGVTGLAARIKAALIKAGYEDSKISVDNADNREDTLVQFKSDKLSYKDLLDGDIKGMFPKLTQGDNLDASVGYDVVIVAGSSTSL